METQKLICAEDVFDSLADGKELTIRKGHRNIQLGTLVFESLETKRTAEVDVEMVGYCQLQNVPLDLLYSEGYVSHDDMLSHLKTFYPELNVETEVTFVIFNSQI